MGSVGLRQGSLSPQEGPADPRPARPHITALQVAIGAFCAFIGALMLVAPHQFSGPAYAPLQDALVWLGGTLVLAGTALVGCVVLGASRRYEVGAHLLAGSALLVFGPAFALTGAWNGLAIYAILGGGTVLAPWLPRLWPRERRPWGDLFASLVGLLSVSNGVMMLSWPGQFSASVFDGIRPQLSLYGLAFLVAGLAMIVAHLHPTLPSRLFQLAHLSILVPFLAFASNGSLPYRLWTGVFVYLFFGLLAASLPWTGPRLRHVDPHSFAVRLAFALAVAAAFPLIATMTVVTGAQEQQARAQAAAEMEALAGALASDTAHYIDSYRNAALALAAYPGLLDLPPSTQHLILRRYQEAYPNAIGFVTRDPTGKGIARSDDRPPDDASGQEFIQELRRTNSPVLAVNMSPTIGRPILSAPAPIRGEDGRLIGIVGVEVESGPVAELLSRAGSASGVGVYLIDATGHVVSHPDQTLVASFADLSSIPPVAALLAAQDDRGTLTFRGAGGETLAAYARVPELGWAVVMEVPATAVLAQARTGRDAAFGLLLAVVALAIIVGSVVARNVAKPLAALARAASGFAVGDYAAHLPVSGTTEVGHLVSSFVTMQNRLAAHEAERDRSMQALKESEEKFSLMFEKAPFAAALSILPDGVLLDINEAFTKTFGWTKSEAVGKTSLELNMNPDAEERARILAEPRAGWAARERELALRTKSGETRVVSSNVDVVDMGGQTYLLNTVQDITERRRAEQGLVEANRQITEILESISDGFFALDRDWRFVYVNSRAAHNIGFEPEEMVGEVIWEKCPFALGNRHEEAYRQVMETRQPTEFEMKSARGTEQWYSMRVYPSASGISVFWTDITEAKRTEAERERLLEEVSGLARFPSENPNPVMRLGADGTILYANPASSPLLSVWRSEPGQAAPEEWRTIVSQVLQAGESREFDLASQGRIFSCLVVPIAAGYANLYARDTTRRRRAEAERERLLAELDAIIQVLPSGIFMYDREGRIIRTNPAADRLFGYSPEELTLPALERQARMEWMDEDGRPLLPEGLSVHPALAGHATPSTTLGFRRAGARQWTWIYVSTVGIFSSAGVQIGVVSAFADITEMKEMGRLKDEFLAVAAHELKTPVAIMKGYAQLLMRRADTIPAIERQLLSGINLGADRLDRLVKDLLDVAQLQQGQLRLTRESLDLTDLVDEVAGRMAVTTGKHEIRVSTDGPVTVQGDRVRLEQVIVNLLDNAIKYSPEGGPIEVGIALRDGEAVVSVQDRGIGIPAEKQGSVFGYFYRAHSGTRYDYGGMGVGLHISREIVDRHGGRMWFESHEGQGSAFYFSLPVGSARDG